MKRLSTLAAALLLSAAQSAPPPSLARKLPPAPEIVLAAAPPPDSGPQRPNKIGDHRLLPAGQLGKGKWTKSPHLWRLALRSNGAAAMRVHFLAFRVGQGQAWVHNGKDWFGPYTGNGLYDDGDFWSHIVPGDRLVLEYAPPPGVKRPKSPPPFQVREVSHLSVNPLE